MPADPKKIVLAYSGGLDTSVMLRWLKERYGCAVVAYAANVGQGDKELEGLEAKALATGADECHVLDINLLDAQQFRLGPRRFHFAVLAEVGSEGDDLAGVRLLQPFKDDRGVEPARIGENDFLDGCRHGAGRGGKRRAGV